MASRQAKATSDATINLRLQESARDLIDRAAAAVGTSRTEFMLDAARRKAEGVLLDRCYFELGGTKFAEFLAILDKRPPSNPRLRQLLKDAPPWE